jgi:hypothetical protein
MKREIYFKYRRGEIDINTATKMLKAEWKAGRITEAEFDYDEIDLYEITPTSYEVEGTVLAVKIAKTIRVRIEITKIKKHFSLKKGDLLDLDFPARLITNQTKPAIGYMARGTFEGMKPSKVPCVQVWEIFFREPERKPVVKIPVSRARAGSSTRKVVYARITRHKR